MNRNFHSVHLEIILPLNILIYSAALSALFRGQLHAYKLGKDETKHRRRPAMQDIYFGFSAPRFYLQIINLDLAFEEKGAERIIQLFVFITAR